MHVAFIAPPLPGHLNPLRALARELARRGHRATLVAPDDARAAWTGDGLGFAAVGGTRGSSRPPDARVAALTRGGPIGFALMLREVARATDLLCDEAPAVLRALDVDLVVADQAEAAGGLVAAIVGRPCVTVASALPLDRDPDVPPPWHDWPPDGSAEGRRRNAVRWRIADALMTPIDRVLARHARRHGLPPGPARAWWSTRATLTQLVDGLDFARAAPPPGFEHVGPWREAAGPDRALGAALEPASDTAFNPALDRAFDPALIAAFDPALAAALAGEARPLAFCSLGTLQGHRAALFARIAAACADAGLAPVIAHGGRLDAAQAAALPGRPIVRDFVPQRAVLARAAVAVVHGGLNTALDAIGAGAPMVVLPLGFEQPGIAARLRHAGVAETLRGARAGRAAIRDAIERVLAGGHRSRAAALAAAIAASGGACAAADRIESVAASARRSGTGLAVQPPGVGRSTVGR